MYKKKTIGPSFASAASSHAVQTILHYSRFYVKNTQFFINFEIELVNWNG